MLHEIGYIYGYKLLLESDSKEPVKFNYDTLRKCISEIEHVNLIRSFITKMINTDPFYQILTARNPKKGN